MKRREFFKWLAAGAATIVGASEVDIDRLLWVPGEKTIFLPPEKTFVVGHEAERLYNYYLNNAAEVVGLSPKMPLVGREVSTAMGRITLDAFENVVAVNGRVVSAREAAHLRATSFTRNNRIHPSVNMADEVARVISERTAAGWADPVGEKPMPYRDMMWSKRKIDF